MMKKEEFDIISYYDSNTSDFAAPKEDSEQEILDYLNSQLIDVLCEFGYLLYKNFSEKELNSINIILEPKKEKRSKYCNNIIRPIQEFKKYSKSNDDVLAGNCLNELKKIKANKGNDPTPLFLEYYHTFKNKHKNDGDAKTVIFKTDLWLSRIPGVFYPKAVKKENIKSGTIVLYLKTICKNKYPNDYLRQVFAHEAFHAFHWLSYEKSIRTSWKYNNFQNDTVKEGLATYFEHFYIEHINSELAKNIKSNLHGYEMNEYPYAAYNYIKTSNVFKKIFELSLEDFGAAYNELLFLRYGTCGLDE